MVIQLEDVIDVLKYKYPEFEYVFFLDHSNGHDRMRPNGLNLNKIGIRYGGKQSRMRDSQLSSSDFFGPFHSSDSPLQVGDIQTMQFSENDPGPCYMSEALRMENRFDRITGKTRSRDITCANMIKALKTKNVKEPCGLKEKLQELCRQHNLPTKFDEPVIKEGWIGKPKGALQILYERGWIDPQNLHKYTAKGKVLDDGVTHYSIDELMSQQEDFLQETTLLQYHASLLGVSLERSPKCHPEIAGEGIEYGWALSKMRYRRSPMEEKKGKESFRKLVRKCLGHTVLDVGRMRACSRKARDYMIL